MNLHSARKGCVIAEYIGSVVGVSCILLCIMAAIEAQTSMSSTQAFMNGAAVTNKLTGSSHMIPSPTLGAPSSDEVIGRLEIPQLALSVPMMAGYDSASLLRGVGHINGTAMPGGLGTMGLAGHRDTYFRPLRKIAVNMEVRVVDQAGTYYYRVDGTEIVKPEQVEVLKIRDQPGMTLVTCYPFDYIGAAPERFIVYAHLMSAAPKHARE